MDAHFSLYISSYPHDCSVRTTCQQWSVVWDWNLKLLKLHCITVRWSITRSGIAFFKKKLTEPLRVDWESRKGGRPQCRELCTGIARLLHLHLQAEDSLSWWTSKTVSWRKMEIVQKLHSHLGPHNGISGSQQYFVFAVCQYHSKFTCTGSFQTAGLSEGQTQCSASETGLP